MGCLKKWEEKIRKSDNRKVILFLCLGIIADLNGKYKDLSLMLPEMDMLRREHSDLILEN